MGFNQALVIALIFLQLINAYVPFSRISSSSILKGRDGKTILFAHHPEKKIIRKIMDKRPIKHRLSDVNRRNVNLNKCITKVEGAPAEYTIVSVDDFENFKSTAFKFWSEGDPSSSWLKITEEDMVAILPQNREPLPVGGVQKRPPILKSVLR